MSLCLFCPPLSSSLSQPLSATLWQCPALCHSHKKVRDGTAACPPTSVLFTHIRVTDIARGRRQLSRLPRPLLSAISQCNFTKFRAAVCPSPLLVLTAHRTAGRRTRVAKDPAGEPRPPSAKQRDSMWVVDQTGPP